MQGKRRLATWGENLVAGVIGAWILVFAVMIPEVLRAEEPFLVVLGIAQDAGYPQAGCRQSCCARAWAEPALFRHAACLAIVDPDSGQRWLVECTPDFRHQLHELDRLVPPAQDHGPAIDGIFLTHAHIGHYAGLVHLGREVMGARDVPVHAMPRMAELLRTAGPWSQLVELRNIRLSPLTADQPVPLNDRLNIVPVAVPHRGEYSETVAFRIEGPNAKALFLPDIDRWELWERQIEVELERVDVALLDATFFDGGELPGRNMAEVPHPLVVDTLKRFQPLDATERAKVRLLHLNHTNPLLDAESAATKMIDSAGLSVAEEGEKIGL